MDFGNGGSRSPDEHEEASNSRKGKKHHYHRHTTQQIQQLEACFKECPHPDENQRRQLSMELGLETKQIKFWFQNKRTQTKAQSERSDNLSLRTTNERIYCENLAIREALKNVICPACSSPPFGDEDQHQNLQNLRMENAQLKAQLEGVSSFLSSFMGRSSTDNQSMQTAIGYSPNMPVLAPNYSGNQVMEGSSLNDDEVSANPNDPISQYKLNGIQELEKSLIIETATNAMDELVKLLTVNEPVWIKSAADGRHVLHRDSYDKLFPKVSHFRSNSARIESSKDSGVVEMSAQQLVEMFLDSKKWMDLFPTIAANSEALGVVDTGDLGGSLHLRYEQLHILSPLVAPREFFFLRYCRQLDPSTWVMVDVSYDFKEMDNSSPYFSWRFPSGCMIQDMANGKSKVAWIEHVQVNDKSLTHRLYRDLVCGSQAYCAKRRIVTLQRMCERFACTTGPRTTPHHELEGVIEVPVGRRSIMKLSHRMVKNFCSSLAMTDKFDFPHLMESRNSGVRVSVRKGNELGQPRGTIIGASTSLWLPLSIEALFNFFRDVKIRPQWDVVSNGKPVSEIAHISCGTDVGNCISIIQPFVPKEDNMLILQESCIDPLGALVVYAPIDLPSISAVINGEDPTYIPILPSGFTICNDSHVDRGTRASTSKRTSGKQGGSLLTVVFQIIVSAKRASKSVDVESSVAAVNTLVSTTVHKIKEALDCTDLD